MLAPIHWEIYAHARQERKGTSLFHERPGGFLTEKRAGPAIANNVTVN
jgi:hypothetical protein